MGLRLPVPFVERRGRLPQAGRIRAGVKTERKGKVTGRALDTFRFTSPRQDDLSILAETYGGTVKPWRDPKSEDRFEVITEAPEIRVILPPDPLGDSPTYELWGGKGLERSCDGITCDMTAHGPEGPERIERPCLCRERQRRECKPMLRLCVILPGLPLRGVWRFDTKSDLAADEMPGMVELILSAQERGLSWALLRLERRQSMGGSHHFVVPALGVPASLEQLVAGHNRVGSLPPSAPLREIGAGDTAPSLPPAPVDNDIVEAEILDEPQFDVPRVFTETAQRMRDEVLKDMTAHRSQMIEKIEQQIAEPSPREKARLLRVARARAALEGREAPTRYEDI